MIKFHHGNARLGIIAALALFILGNQSAAAETLRDWIHDHLHDFGDVASEPKPQANNQQVYYFKANVNFPSTSQPMFITLTCIPQKEGGAFCSANSTTGAPPNFPPAFQSPVYP